MADRIIKGDSGNDVIIQNNDASRKIEVTNSGDVEVTGDLKATTVKATNLKASDGTSGISIADSTGRVTANEIILTDDIQEKTSAHGVEIEGILLKDSIIQTDDIQEKTSAHGVEIDGVTLKDNNVNCTDVIASGSLTTTGDATVNSKFILGGRTELTISSGVITVTRSYHEVDTEGDAGNDDLDTINGGTQGMICTFKSASSGRDVTFKDATGNITLSGDRQLNHYQDTLTLIYDGAGWRELCFSDNTAG